MLLILVLFIYVNRLVIDYVVVVRTCIYIRIALAMSFLTFGSFCLVQNKQKSELTYTLVN